MKLAIEMSTPHKSVALQNAEGEIYQEIWREDRSQPDPLHDKLEDLLRNAEVQWSGITAVYSGIGPGQYSGMRAAVSTAAGLALPGDIPSRGISSGWALATACAGERGATRIAVIGDARRSNWWCGVLDVEEEGPTIVSDWALYPEGRAKEQLESLNPEIISTSEMERCSGLQLNLIEQYPQAEDLLALAGTGLVTAPLPIYLHPAVQLNSG